MLGIFELEVDFLLAKRMLLTIYGKQNAQILVFCRGIRLFLLDVSPFTADPVKALHFAILV